MSQDAKPVADTLGITLTVRKDGMKIAGFPYHALDTYLPKLIRAGHRVAICDTLEDNKHSVSEIVSSNNDNE